MTRTERILDFYTWKELQRLTAEEKRLKSMSLSHLRETPENEILNDYDELEELL